MPERRSLALLRRANPVNVEPAAVHSPQARSVFEQIVAQPRIDPSGRRGGRRLAGGRLGLGVRLAFGGIGFTAAVAAIVVAVLSGSAAAPAFAGWTAKPAVALLPQMTNATHHCGLTSPVLTEARGPYTAAVFASKLGGTACVTGPGTSFVGSVGGARAPDNRFKPDQIGIAVKTGANANGQGFVLVTGRVGSAVRSIKIHRTNHIDVIASVKDGWFLAWWPAGARATYATVTTPTGAHKVALPQLAKTDPSCGVPTRLSNGHQLAAGCASSTSGSNGPGSDGIPGPPLIGNPISKPFRGTLLFNVWDATSVLVCFHPPANLSTALQQNGPTGPCSHATLLTRLPPGYPVQKNLLEVFPKGVWAIKVPARDRSHGMLKFLVIARSTWGYGPREELTVTW